MSEDHVVTIDRIISDLIEPNAVRIDEEGVFPRANLDAIAAAGLLGLVSSADVGGGGQGLKAAAEVVRRIAEHCTSTAMILCMHYVGTVVIENFGQDEVRREIASGNHLTSLAFSERGSRSQFWAPVSSARAEGGNVILDASKSWVTSAPEADSYVWSSRPVEADGASTIWFVPTSTGGIKVDAPFTGLGLRGNQSSPVSATAASIPAANRLGDDGGGFDIMINTVLPWFCLMNASSSVGVMAAALARSAEHLSTTRLEHLDQTLADNPVNRLHLGTAKVQADQAATLVADAIEAVTGGREDAMLRVLQSKAAAADAAIVVTDACMHLCGGAAFRKEVGVERSFRDARAASVMAPTSDVLYDFIGKALCGIPLF